jgi:hypothetical protein
MGYRVVYNGAAIGVWRNPECSAARWLLEQGLAVREDRLETWRNAGDKDMRCLIGSVGWFADRTMREDSGTGTPRFAMFTPWQGPFTAGEGDNDKGEPEGALP